jgi:tripartite-type tricarboxylate transporter receptor subunit TctC
MTCSLPALPRRRALAAGAAWLLSAPLARAQGYPSKPIRLVLPNAPGSSVDTMARQLAVPLAAGLGQPIVVENVPGAGGVLGVSQILRAPRDGHTVGIVANNFAISSHLYRLPYNPAKDVVPVCVTTTGAMVLMVHPKVQARNLRELTGQARARSASELITYGSAGVGTVGHLAGALMEMSSGAEFLHIPYKGQNGFTTDLIGGQIDAGFLATAVALPLIRNGSLRAIAVTTSHRVSSLPDVPTMAEAGLPGYELGGSQAVIIAAGTPPAIVRRLNAEVVRAMHAPEIKRMVEDQGSQVVASSVEEAQRWFVRDFEVYGKLAKRIGLKPEN